MVLPFMSGTRPCSQRHSFEHQARHLRRRARSSRAAFQNEIATGKRCSAALRLDGRVLPRARANGVQDVELVRRANGDRTLCERVEEDPRRGKTRSRILTRSRTACMGSLDRQSSRDHNIGPVRNDRDVVGVPRLRAQTERRTMLASKKASRSRRRADSDEAWPDEPAAASASAR